QLRRPPGQSGLHRQALQVGRALRGHRSARRIGCRRSEVMSKNIVIRGVVIVYRGRGDQEPVLACDGIDLEVGAGRFVSIVGPSGCGKTTLLYAIDGLLPINQGEIRVGEHSITGPGTDRAMVFQSASLLPWRTVWSNITYGLRLHRGLDGERLGKVDGLIEMVGLRGFEQRYPSELSGGMQQRANLQVELTQIWARTGKTMVFVTHDIAEAVFLSDQVIVFSARPARVREIVDIDMPRPRSLETKHSGAVQEYIKQLWNLIESPN